MFRQTYGAKLGEWKATTLAQAIEENRADAVDVVSGLGAEDSPIKQTVIITHDTDIFEDTDVDMVYRFEKTSEDTKVAAVPDMGA